jgi:type II secretory pathway component PulC
MKKSVFIISFLLIFSVFFTFVFYLNTSYNKIQKEINSKKKEIALKTLRNSILLLNLYEPVEVYLDYPVKTTEFYNFTTLNIRFCKEKIAYKKIYLIYNNEENCVEIIN